MELEKYTDRAKSFLQSAQTMALRRGHQRLTPEHLLKVLLEDTEGLCADLIRAVRIVAGAGIYVDPVLKRATINRDECVECYACYNGLSKEVLPPSTVRFVRRTLANFRVRADSVVK